MAATFAGTITSPSGTALANRPVQVFPLGAAAVSVSPVDAFSDANGDFSLSIPSGIRCLFVVPDMQIHHILTPAADDTLSLTDLLDGDASGAWES